MRRGLVLVVLSCVPLLALDAAITLPMPGMVSARSRSGQFVVYGPPPQTGPATRASDSSGTNLIRLEPPLVAISCERIKHAMLLELGAPDRWQGRFYIVLHPGAPPDQTIQVTSSRFANGWLYRVDMPAQLEPDRFVRAVVRMLLVEWINRCNPGELVEAPAWLSEGLAERVLENSPLDLLVPPPTYRGRAMSVSTVVRQGWLTNHLVKAHQLLRKHEPLALSELVAPTQTGLVGEAALVFRYSAQVLVDELFQLPNGRAAICSFLDALAFAPDAELALLHALAPHFRSYGEMERWWTLKSYHFTSRDFRTQAWPAEEVLAQLDAILQVHLLTRSDTNNPPTRTSAPIQSSLQDNWDQPWLRNTLRFKATQLQALQLRAPQELAPIIFEYRKLFANLADRLSRARATPADRSSAAKFIQQAISKLNALDARRAALAKKLLTAETFTAERAN